MRSDSVRDVAMPASRAPTVPASPPPPPPPLIPRPVGGRRQLAPGALGRGSGNLSGEKAVRVSVGCRGVSVGLGCRPCVLGTPELSRPNERRLVGVDWLGGQRWWSRADIGTSRGIVGPWGWCLLFAVFGRRFRRSGIGVARWESVCFLFEVLTARSPEQGSFSGISPLGSFGGLPCNAGCLQGFRGL